MLVINSPAYLLLLAAPVGLAGVSFWRRGRLGSMAARCLALILLVVALAQPEWRQSAPANLFGLLLDTSNSITAADRAIEAGWLRAAAAQASAASPVTAIPFAGSASAVTIRGPLGNDQIAQLLAPRRDGSATNLAAALHLAAGLAPGTRLVLLTDGNQTIGDAAAAAADLAAAHLPLATVLLGHQATDVAITRLVLPPLSAAGSVLPAQITVSSTRAVTATLTLRVDGQNLGSQSLGLLAGENPYLLNLPAQSPGWHVLHANIQAPADAVPENNALDTVTDVSRVPRVLVVATHGAASTAVTVFRDSTLDITALTPSAMPSATAALARYDGVILDDVPATALNARQVSALDGAVRRDGVGLFVLGGSHSLTQGHYSQTGLEKMLPVLSDTPASLQDGNVALQLVLDRSGSMDNLAGDVPKIVMSREAARLASDFAVQHKDDLGIVAFDQASHLLVPITKVGAADKPHVYQVIAGMFSDGGTNIFQALQTGLQQVSKSSAPYRHIILMTDGRSDPANYLPLLQEAQQLKVTISTVGLGPDADVQLLHYMAALGKGRFYYTTNAQDLPRIFAEEARLAAGSAAVTGKIGVKIAHNSPTIRSLGAGPLPALNGYTATVLKPDAVNDLETNVQGRQADPLLARGHYGLGRVLVWTPGLENTWSALWRKTEPAFWADTLRWTLRGPSVPTYAPALAGGSTPNAIAIDTLKNSGAAVNLQRLTIDVRTPTGGHARLAATQTAPGLYEAGYSFAVPGIYTATVGLLTGGTLASGLLAVPYSSEYLPSAPNGALLADLSARTGGASVRAPSQIVTARANAAGPVELWWPLALIALIVFLAAVVVDRLPARTSGAAT